MSVVPAAAQVLAVLQYLSRQAGPVPAGSISRDVGLPRSTTYHLLETMQRAGFVTHLPEERRYGLGLSAYELASGYDRQAPLQRLARTPIAKLVDTTGYTAHLAVLHGRDVVYVIEERAPRRAPLITDVGVRLPAAGTASGRAMLACLPNAQVAALLPNADAFVIRNDDGPRSPSALRQLLVGTRRKGFAEEHDEVTPGYSSIAVPVRDHLRYPIAAVALTVPARRAADLEPLVRHVARTAAELGRRVGGH
jgi:DNA-binding IclR family transcriptional regulator